METTQKPYAFSRKVFCEGMRDGVPIALGYFAVSFSLRSEEHTSELQSQQPSRMPSSA